jgi:tyrosinase
VSSAAQSDLASLSKGVNEMKKLITSNPSDPRGWVVQAFIHGDCTRFTDCQHGNWYFPPWHRSFIYYFEQLIQFFSGDANFALPYWDWSRTHSVPGSFYGSGNPLDDNVSVRDKCGSSAPSAGRGRSATDQFSQADLDIYVGLARINSILQNPDYATFGGGNPGTGQLEATPHNFIHRWVGGSKGSNMVRTYSPLDPIFWMHHCNIDRLYSNWLARGFKTPPDSQWRDRSFNNFYDSKGNKVGSEFTCAMTVDSTVMGYVYDQVLEMPKALAAAPGTAAKQAVVGSVAASKGTLKDGVLSFVTDAAPPAQTRQLMNAAAVGMGDYVVRLRIEGVDVPERQNTGVHVFLGPNVTPETPTTAPGYVGSFTFFDGPGNGGGGGEHQHGSRTLLLNASEALRELYGDVSLPEGANLSVSIVTRPLYEGVEAFAKVEELQPDKIQFDVVDLDA